MKSIASTTALLCAAWALVLATGCHRSSAGTDAMPLQAAAVHVQKVQFKERVATEEVVGTVRAKLRAVVEAKISGRIEKMPAVPGQTVASGDLLAELDAREVQARADQAQAVYQQAEADWKRFSTLWDQKVLSRAEYDTAKSKFAVAQAALLEAKTMVDYAKVTAPFDGIIMRKLADVGDLAAPGKPLLEMEDARDLRLETDVPEAVVSNIKLGDRLPVRIDSLDSGLEGVVSEMAPAADPNSRTFLVKLDLPSAGGLRAGQFGRASVPIGKASALRVPATAVIQRGQMELVFVAADGRAQLRIVKTGKRVGGEIEIVSGLDAGESVIIDDVAQLQDGQPISIL